MDHASDHEAEENNNAQQEDFIPVENKKKRRKTKPLIENSDSESDLIQVSTEIPKPKKNNAKRFASQSQSSLSTNTEEQDINTRVLPTIRTDKTFQLR